MRVFLDGVSIAVNDLQYWATLGVSLRVGVCVQHIVKLASDEAHYYYFYNRNIKVNIK